jgi:predicted AlkP superfamily phosphohydrolase/phosphomutase
MRTPKLLLIAVDSGDSQLVREWASQGHLPAFAELLDAGLSAPMKTPVGVLEGAIWPTLLTSSSPGRHGMFAYRQLDPGSYRLDAIMRADRLPSPPFWSPLSAAGKRVAIIDAPFARPAADLNGIQVTNWGAHDAWSWERSSWPPDLVADLARRFGDHPVATCDGRDRTLADFEDLRDRLIDGVERKTALLRHCLELEDWDFFLGVFSESHCTGHQHWRFMDPGCPGYDPAASPRLRTAIRDVYRAIDAGLASLLRRRHPDTHAMVLLSHGMGPYYHGSHLLNRVLDRLGVNDPGRSRGSAGRPARSRPLRERMWHARHLIPRSWRDRLKARVPVGLVDAARPRVAPPARRSTDLSLKRVFQVPSSNMTAGLRINLKGREPAGLVEPGAEYDALCRGISEALLALENPATGGKAVQWVARADDLYRGPRLDWLPDLLVEWDHSGPITAVRSPAIGTVSGVARTGRSASHWPNALLLGAGPRFRPGPIAGALETMDLGPTILEFFGVARPPDFEGTSALADLCR